MILDNKSKQIADEIEAAKNLKDKASMLLNKTERYQKEAEQYVQNLLKNAEIEAQKLTIESQRIVEAEIAKKTAASIERIKIEEESAIREIKNKIVSSAIQNISKNIAGELNQANRDKLVGEAMNNFEKLLSNSVN